VPGLTRQWPRVGGWRGQPDAVMRATGPRRCWSGPPRSARWCKSWHRGGRCRGCSIRRRRQRRRWWWWRRRRLWYCRGSDGAGLPTRVPRHTWMQRSPRRRNVIDRHRLGSGTAASIAVEATRRQQPPKSGSAQPLTGRNPPPRCPQPGAKDLASVSRLFIGCSRTLDRTAEQQCLSEAAGILPQIRS